MKDSRSCEEIPVGFVGRAVTGAIGCPVVETVEASKRIDNSSLKKRKTLFRLPQKPSAMAG
jgi:hypothetical protein